MLLEQKNTIERVREYAITRNAAQRAYVEDVCGSLDVDADALIAQMLKNRVTINFHPDRWSNNGKTIIQNLTHQGMYHSQFLTGTTNGGKTAYVGGERFLWEQRLFFHAYAENSLERPKYGAFNLFGYADGASVRFGSCFFTLKQEVANRCTFAYGDSSANPATLCTSDTFIGILAELLTDAEAKGRLLNRVVSSTREAVAMLLTPREKDWEMGRNLDYCIEAHVHGNVMLREDVESLSVDESFQNTPFGQQAEELCAQYAMRLSWIPKRQLEVRSIGPLFRGPKIPALAQRIDCLLGDDRGVMNACLIGQASRVSERHPERFREIGNREELFQYFKQLWHMVGYFG